MGCRERHRPGRNHPRHDLDGVSARTDGWIGFLESSGLLRIDIEDRESPKLIIEKRACSQEMTRLVKIREVRHVCVLQSGRRCFVQNWGIGTEHQPCDREAVELHAPDYRSVSAGHLLDRSARWQGVFDLFCDRNRSARDSF